MTAKPTTQEALFEFLLRLGDDQLILGQRISEWCGHGPILEEDVALSNIALDLFGQAEIILGLAGEIEGKGRDADALAYWRDELAFRNLQLLERPRGDFGDTIARLLLFDAFAWLLFDALCKSADERVAGLAAKAIKETTYHLRHAKAWTIRLGDGTAESRTRMQEALEAAWPFVGEIFFTNEVDEVLVAADIIPDIAALQGPWNAMIDKILAEATLTRPEDPPHWEKRARLGQHSEHLGHLLANMQIVARSHPGAKW